MPQPIPVVSAEAVIGELEKHALANTVIALDADGTLWSGDVGEGVLEHFVQHEWLRQEALPALEALAARFDVPRQGSANAIANAMFQAYRAGSFPEREICEMMTWCYAGFGVEEFRERVRELLVAQNFQNRLQRELLPIVEWAKLHAVRTVVISASPQIVVEEALKYWDIGSANIAASCAVVSGSFFAPRLAGPTPYAAAKLSAGRALFGDAVWLASFGDNVFDLEMLQAAHVAVLVRPKPELLARAHELRACVRLADPTSG